MHPTAMPLLAERGSRRWLRRQQRHGPERTQACVPIHSRTDAMGILLLDYLQLEDLSTACEAAGDGFMCVAGRCGSSRNGLPGQPLAICSGSQ